MRNLSDNVRGALFMSISMAGFALNDAIIKLISAELGLYQIIFLRGIFVTLAVGLLVLRQGGLFYLPARRDAGIMALRAAGEVGGTLCFLTALFNMPIANATAILQALPLAVTLAAALFLGEKVGWRRYTAITVGFTGVLIIVRPGSEGFNAYALWVVAAVGFIVLQIPGTQYITPTSDEAYGWSRFLSCALHSTAGCAKQGLSAAT